MRGVDLWRVVVLFLCAALPAVAETNDIEHAMVTDSDGDGATDWEEWLAHTNPGDSNSCFEIVSIEYPSSGTVVRWRSVGSLSYRIHWCDSIAGLPAGGDTEILRASGGTPPWDGTESVATDSANAEARFMAVELVVPQELDEIVADMSTFE